MTEATTFDQDLTPSVLEGRLYGAEINDLNLNWLASTAIPASNEALRRLGISPVSVGDYDELPAGLTEEFVGKSGNKTRIVRPENLPGILFETKNVRATDAINAFQYHADAYIHPDESQRPTDGMKYRQDARGEGSATCAMTLPTYDRFCRYEADGVSFDLWLFEGTKQHLSAVAALKGLTRDMNDANILASGMNGCYGWKQNGRLHEGIRRMLPLTRKLYVTVDGDHATNLSVWQAAMDLRAAVKLEPGNTQVLFVNVPPYEDEFGTKTPDSLDTYLGRYPENERTERLNNLRKTATATIGKKPKVNALDVEQNTVGVVDWDKAQIRMADRRHGSDPLDTVPGLVLAPDWAARIVNEDRLIDDKRPDEVAPITTFDVEVKDARTGDVDLVRGIRDDELGDIPGLLKKIQRVGGSRKSFVNTTANRAEVEAAIRAYRHDDETSSVTLRRTGLYFDPATEQTVFVLPQGAMRPDGSFDKNIRSRVTARIKNAVELPDLTQVSQADKYDAIRRVANAMNQFDNPLVYLAVMGTHFASSFGKKVYGGLSVTGDPNVGKSYLLMNCSTIWGDRFAFGREICGVSLNGGTAQPKYTLGEGLEGFAVLLDDVKNVRDLKKDDVDVQTHAVDRLGRRVTEGSVAGHKRMVPDPTMPGNYMESSPDPCEPYGIVSAESLDAMRLMASSEERFLSVHLESMREGSSEVFDSMVDDGVFALANALHIQRTLQVINGYDKVAQARRIEHHRSHKNGEVAQAMQAIRDADGGQWEKSMMVRGFKVGTQPLVGAWAFMQLVRTMPKSERPDWFTKRNFADVLVPMVAAASQKHWVRKETNNSNPTEALLQAIRSADGGKIRFLDQRKKREPNEGTYGPRIAGATWGQVGDVDVIFIVADAVAEALVGETAKSVKNKLESIKVPGTHKVRLGGASRPAAIAIPMAVWDPEYKTNDRLDRNESHTAQKELRESDDEDINGF